MGCSWDSNFLTNWIVKRYLAVPLPYVWGSDHKKQYVSRSCDRALQNPWSCHLELAWRTQSLRVDGLHYKQCGCSQGGKAVRSTIMGDVKIIVFGAWPIIWTTTRDLSFPLHRSFFFFFSFFKSPPPLPATALKSIQQSKNSNSA